MWLKDVGGLRNCLKSLKFLEHLCRALGTAFGKGDKLLSTAVVRYESEEEPQSTEAASWAEVMLLGGCGFAGFRTNSDEF